MLNLQLTHSHSYTHMNVGLGRCLTALKMGSFAVGQRSQGSHKSAATLGVEGPQRSNRGGTFVTPQRPSDDPLTKEKMSLWLFSLSRMVSQRSQSEQNLLECGVCLCEMLDLRSTLFTIQFANLNVSSEAPLFAADLCFCLT